MNEVLSDGSEMFFRDIVNNGKCFKDNVSDFLYFPFFFYLFASLLIFPVWNLPWSASLRQNGKSVCLIVFENTNTTLHFKLCRYSFNHICITDCRLLACPVVHLVAWLRTWDDHLHCCCWWWLEASDNVVFSVDGMYLQVRNDYMKDLAERVEHDMAIRLGCIEMRYAVKQILFNIVKWKKTKQHYSCFGRICFNFIL